MPAEVAVKFPEALDLSEIKGPMDEVFKAYAERVRDEARASTAFEDRARKLRPSIRIKKSKFEDGGYIVYSKEPHAHLVELGHLQVRNGKVVGFVPAHSFLRTALEKVAAELGSEIGR